MKSFDIQLFFSVGSLMADENESETNENPEFPAYVSDRGTEEQ